MGDTSIEWTRGPDGVPRSKKANGSRLDGQLHDAMPLRPGALLPSAML